MRHSATCSSATASLRGLSLAAALFAACSGVAGAAGIYVIDSRIERDGVSSLAPTFIATPGERALIVFDGERDIEVAMTVMAREGASADGALEVHVELIEDMTVSDARLDVTLGRPGTVTIGEREVSVLVREQVPLPDAAPEGGSAPASADTGTPEDGSNGAVSTGESAGTDEANPDTAVQGDDAQGGADQN